MTRTQKYDPQLLTEKYLKNHPEASNDDLYSLCHATTKSQKGYIRKRKSRLLIIKETWESVESIQQKVQEKTSNNNHNNIEKKIFTALDEATIEKLIIDLLNEDATESRIKLAVEFHNKVKGSDVLRLEEPLDMEGFLKYELSEREEEGNTSIH